MCMRKMTCEVHLSTASGFMFASRIAFSISSCHTDAACLVPYNAFDQAPRHRAFLRLILVGHLHLRGVFSARGPISSVGGVPVVKCPDVDHMEEEVQVSVQVEEEEMGETHRKEQSEEHSARALCRRKSDVWSVPSTLHVGYNRLLSAVNETHCNKHFLNEVNSWAPPVSQFHQESLKEEGCHLRYWWEKWALHVLRLILERDGSWLWL